MTTQYQIKVYDSQWTNLIKTISPKDIISDISFSCQINWGQGELNIEINDKFNSSYYSYWNIVEVMEYSDFYKAWRNIYKWYISQIVREQEINKETITLTCLWLASLLQSCIFLFTTTNIDPANLIKTILDDFDSKIPWLIWYGSNIDNFWQVLNISTSTWTSLDTINTVAKTTNFYRYVDQYGEFFFKAKPIVPTHYLTNQKDIERISLSEDGENIVNRIILKEYFDVYHTYDDIPSQTQYWLLEWYYPKPELVNTASRDAFAQSEFDRNSTTKKKTSIVVNNKYDLVTLQPWQTIKVRNFDYSIDNLQINKVQYSTKRVTLDLEDYISFGKLLTNN